MPCPLCAFDDWTYAFTIDGVHVQRCQTCSLARSDPTALPGGTSHVDAEVDDVGAPDLVTRTSSSAACMRALERRGPLPSPLMAVVERGHPLPALVRRLGAEVEEIDVAQLDSRRLSPVPFNGAVLIDQLERSSNPIRSLEIIHGALAAEAVLVAVVSSIDVSGPFRRWRSERRAIRPYYFSRDTLESALIRSGFSHVSFAPVRWGDSTSHLLVTARPAARRPRPLLSVIVPVYNEKAYFATTMNALLGKHVPGVDKEIVVVESHSTDGTREAVLAYAGHPDVQIVLEDRPFGKGHAVRTAFDHVGGDLVLIQDADCEYDIDDYDELLRPLLTYRTAFVLGSRHSGDWKIRQFDAEPHLGTLVNLGHQLFVFLVNVLYGQRLSDPFTMYKVFRRDCLHGLKFECNRFDFDFELVIKLIRKGYRPLEIPVSYRSRSWAEGKKIRIVRDPLTWVRALVKYRFAGIFKEARRGQTNPSTPAPGAPTPRLP